MKPARFDYVRPESLEAATAALAGAVGYAKVLAGGQSLGPMLNLRLAQPDILVDVTRLPGVREARRDADAVVLGACVTHAAIEDGRVPDATNGMLPAIAGRLAYRAVRNRGTVGGSLAHADPSADWVTALAAADATVVLHGPGGRRSVPAAGFVVGAFETALAPEEILVEIRIPGFSPGARWGWYKVCRKAGEFADAMAAVVVDPKRGLERIVLGATNGAPVVLDGAEAVRAACDRSGAKRLIAEAAVGGGAIERQRHAAALHRAALQVAP